MRELGLRIRPSERPVKQIVKRQGREPLFSAYHVRYLHQVVIHDVGQMIGRQPVSRFIEHFVVQCRGVHRYLAADKVVHMHLLVFGHHEADDPLVAPFDTRAHFLVGHGQRGRQPASYLIIICESVAPLFRFRTQGIQSLRSIEGIVGIA